METKVYEKLSEPIADSVSSLNELKISVDYTLGGMNYFSGNVSRRGIYLFLKPVSRSGGIESSIMMSGDRKREGYKILLEELPRKNQKKIDAQFAKIKPITKIIADYYLADRNDEIVEMVKS